MGQSRGVLHGVFVLLVEDHDDTRDYLRTMLEYHGAAATAVASADEAMRVLEELRVDVVITDIGLRQKPGTWLLEEVRRTPRLARTPVIAVTGRIVPWSLRTMFDGFLEKPVDLDQLCNAVLRASRRTS
jgi:CheY-like chemotaxis protein